jgi:hypothetical protein
MILHENCSHSIAHLSLFIEDALFHSYLIKSYGNLDERPEKDKKTAY